MSKPRDYVSLAHEWPNLHFESYAVRIPRAYTRGDGWCVPLAWAHVSQPTPLQIRAIISTMAHELTPDGVTYLPDLQKWATAANMYGLCVPIRGRS